MNKWIFFILGWWCAMCFGGEPFKPRDRSVPFLVYFLSHYRGLCVGTLVSRTAVITAAVCIADPISLYRDTRPINVVTGATYRHPRRGIRVQVTKIILPKIPYESSVVYASVKLFECIPEITCVHQMKVPNITVERAFRIQKSPAILLLARKVPDVLAEVPLRAVELDYKNGGENPIVLSMHDECLILGWHFFYKGDKIYPVHKFLLQRNLRGQYVIVVKKTIWCNTLSLKYQNAMTSLGYTGDFDLAASICVKDGMYGAPLLCHGKMVGMMTAPDGQWSNCTGYTNLIHLLKSKLIINFMECVSRLFIPDFAMDWVKFKKSLEEEGDGNRYDYLPELYDKVLYESSSSAEET